MIDREKLVGVVALDLKALLSEGPLVRRECPAFIETVARAALAAIDASGIAWVAPWELPDHLDLREARMSDSEQEHFRVARDACFAERRGEGR